MRCCSNPVPPITVTTGTTAVSLERCGRCGDQRWLVAGTPVTRDQAFGALAQAYRHRPLEARAVRDRAATVTAARAAARLALRTGVPESRQVLSAMLTGWQVLGAAS
jgi:hypothetical protein